MKKTKIVLFSLAFAVLFSACSWQAPEKISVKTNAKYSFSLGTIEPELSDLNFSKEELFKNLTLENAKVYDYFPEKKDPNVQRFMMQIPLMDIPVDVGSYFDKTDLSDTVKAMSFEQDIEVPVIDFANETSIELGAISASINKAATFYGPVTTLEQNPNFAADFTKIVYETGEIEVYCEDMPDGQSVTLSSGNNRTTATFLDKKAVLPLHNFEITKSGLQIKFTTNLATGYEAKIKESSVLSRVEGITFEMPASIPLNLDIDAMKNADDAFESCVISEGSVKTVIKLPESWNGVSISYSLATAGGINVTSPKTEGYEKSFDLKNASITPAKTHVSADIFVKFADATYVPADALKFICSSSISKIKSVALEIKGVEKHVASSEKLPAEVLDSVQSIEFGSSGLKGKFENNLPAGNAITIDVASKFLALTDTKTLETGRNSDFEILTTGNNVIYLSKTPDIANRKFDSWDFDVELKLPGATAEKPDRIEVVNVEPGKKYHIGFSVEPILDWKKINIDSSMAKTGEQTETFDLGLKNAFDTLNDTLGEELVKSLKLSELNIYLYCVKPGLQMFENAKIKGKIQMRLTDHSNNDIKDDNNNPISEDICKVGDEIGFVSSPNLEIKDNVVISDLSKIDSSIHANIAKFVNASLKNDCEMKLIYDVSFTNSDDGNDLISITPDLLGDNTGASISVIAIIEIPMQMEIGSEIRPIELNKMMNLEDGKDLLGRDGPSNTEDIQQFMDVLKSASIDYEFKKFPLKGLENLELYIKFTDQVEKYLNLKSGSIKIQSSEVESLMREYPLIPELKLDIKKGTVISIPRELAVAMKMSLSVETDGEIDIMGGKK